MKNNALGLQAHVHIYNYFGGVSTLLVPDNCKTAVIHTKDWYSPKLNATYHEMVEHYGTAIREKLEVFNHRTFQKRKLAGGVSFTTKSYLS